jgi:hypothetical protein
MFMHKRTWKEFGKRMDEYKSFTECWPGEHTGRYVKRQLSKVRRRCNREFIEEELFDIPPHLRGLDGIEREANWKTW